MNVPNALTLLRISLAPLLVIALWELDAPGAALLVFAAGMTSDVLDGRLARSRGLVTNFGKLMDPIADKLFIGTAFVCLAADDRVAVWVVGVVFARELLVTALRLVARREGVIISASQLGKAKTVIQAIVVFVLIAAGPQGLLPQALVYLMVAITVVSGVAYAAGFLRGRRPAEPAPANPLRATA
jgi:CDP-diacylglycerol---glycerol-3-phosphate 3-phosphatidyltransferase